MRHGSVTLSKADELDFGNNIAQPKRITNMAPIGRNTEACSTFDRTYWVLRCKLRRGIALA